MTAQTAIHSSVLQKLSDRDSIFPNFIFEITENYNQLYLRNRKLEDENESLKKDNLIYKQSNSDPQALQNLREANADLQRKITNNYEDHKKLQETLIGKIEENTRLTEKNTELVQENTKFKEQVSSLDKNLKTKEQELKEKEKELENVTNDRNRAMQMHDSLKNEVTKLTNENNQVISHWLCYIDLFF